MVEVEYSINIDGDIDEDYINRSMIVLGELIIQKIRDNIRSMKLIENGQFLQNWVSSYKEGVLLIENTQEYSLYLEYGTYAYWQMNRLNSYTEPPDPKKKDLSPEAIKLFPKGMQSFAPLRKVLYNEKVMEILITKAFKSQI